MDKNSDGVLTLKELVAAFGRDGARELLRAIDRNGDNRLSIQELRKGRGNGRSRSNRERDDDDDDDDDDD